MHKKCNIFIIGLSIQGNKGASLLLRGLINSLQQYYNTHPVHQYTEVHINMQSPISSDLHIKTPPFGIQKIVPTLNIYKKMEVYIKLILGMRQSVQNKYPLIQEIANADIIIDCSGISFHETKNASLTIQIKEFIKHISSGLDILIAKKHKKKYFKFTQTIGPLYRPISRLIAKFVLKKVSLIIPRDEASFEQLKKLSLTNITPPYPDIALTLPPQKSHITISNTKRLTVGICISEVLNRHMQQQTTQNVLPLIQLCTTVLAPKKDWNIIIIPHADSTYTKDIELSTELQQSLSEKGTDSTLITGIDDALELKHIISQCDIFIGARYHSLISSLSCGIPTIALSWNHKYKGLLSLFNQEHFVLSYEDISVQTMNKMIDTLIQKKETISLELETYIPKVSKRAQMATNEIMNVYYED